MSDEPIPARMRAQRAAAARERGADPTLPRRWTPVRVLDAETAQVLAVPLSLTLCGFVFVLWTLLTPLGAIAIDRVQLLEIAFALPPLHAVMRGMAGKGAETRVPANGWLAQTKSAPMSRARYLGVLALPLFALSFIPLVLAAIAGSAPGEIVVTSLFNALASGSDALAAVLAIAQVPRGAAMRCDDDGVAWTPAIVVSARGAPPR